MREPLLPGNQPSNFFAGALHQANALFTPRRVSYSLVGTFILVGGTIALHNNTVASQSNDKNVQNYNNQVAPDNSTPKTSSEAIKDNSDTGNNTISTHTSFSAKSSNGTSKVQLNVNGQDIPVPQNGSSTQTVTNDNGSQTTVDVSGNTSSQGGTSNQSTSSFSLNVQNNSTSSGATTNSE